MNGRTAEVAGWPGPEARNAHRPPRGGTLIDGGDHPRKGTGGEQHVVLISGSDEYFAPPLREGDPTDRSTTEYPCETLTCRQQRGSTLTRKLEGKIAVVTGGSTGIGLATAKRFVEEGAFVFITGRRATELERAEQSIGRNVKAVQGDIAKLTDIDRLYATLKETHGHIDVLVANAGFIELATTANATPEHFDKTFGINARGTFFTVQKAFPLLTDGSAIVLISSASHVKGIPAYATYAATKAAIRSFARSWAAELKGRQIRVNVLTPGSVDTPIIDAQWPTEGDARRVSLAKMMPLGRLGTADEIAAAALFLASSDSSYCTGIELVADGGFTQL